MASWQVGHLRPKQSLEAGIESVMLKGLNQSVRLSDLSGGGSGVAPS